MSRMTLAAISRKPRIAPDRVLLAGVDGIGKSTFAAGAPGVVFICPEDGLVGLDPAPAHFPEPRTWSEVLEALRVLRAEDHPYKTVAMDTVDWLEPLIHRHVCDSHGWSSIEEPGYGKGYIPATEEWRTMIAALDALRREKCMEVILLAHVTIKTFSNPTGADYSRYECKLQRSAAALLREWVDAVLFATHEEFVTEQKGTTRSKGVSTGRRVIYTERTAAWDAKNRHSLPPELPLDYADYAAARAAGQPASAELLLNEARDLLVQLGPEGQAIGQEIAKHRDDAGWLYRAVTRLRSKVSEKETT